MVSDRDYVAEMRRPYLKKLTELLCLPPDQGTGTPSSAWLATQSHFMASLPKLLLRPTNPFKRLAVHLSEQHDLSSVLPEPAVLCTTHRQLNPWIIRRLFHLLTREVTIHVDRIRRFNTHPDQDGSPTEAVKAFIRRMDGVSALYMSDATFVTWFRAGSGRGLSADELRDSMEGLERMQSGCEACMLAAVGSRGQILADLRGNVLARAPKRYRPALLRVVDCWISCFGTEAAELLKRESKKTAKELKAVRKVISQLRREKKAAKRGMAITERSEAKERIVKKTLGVKGSGDEKKRPRTEDGHLLPRKEKEMKLRHGELREREDEVVLGCVSADDYSSEGGYQGSDGVLNLAGDETLRYNLGEGSHPHGKAKREPYKDIGDEEPLLGLDDDHPIDMDEDEDEQMDIVGDDDAWKDEFFSWYARSMANENVNPSTIHPAFRPSVITQERSRLQSPLPPHPVAPSALPQPLSLQSPKAHDPDTSSNSADVRSWVSATVHTVGGQAVEEEEGLARELGRQPSLYGWQPQLYEPSSVYSQNTNPQTSTKSSRLRNASNASDISSDDTAQAFDYSPSVHPIFRIDTFNSTESVNPFSSTRRRRRRAAAERIPQSPLGTNYESLPTEQVSEALRVHHEAQARATERYAEEVASRKWRQKERMVRQRDGTANEGEEGDDAATIFPDDSISNVAWRRPAAGE